MRISYFALFGCLLVLGCASPSQPPKPSPYHYGAVANVARSDHALANPARALVSTQKPSHGR